jgi:hypothetical protein
LLRDSVMIFSTNRKKSIYRNSPRGRIIELTLKQASSNFSLNY